MTMQDQFLEIRDTQVNTEEIMRRIQERIRERRAKAQSQGLDYDHLTDDSRLVYESGALSSNLYYELYQLRTVNLPLWVAVDLYDSHLPIINSWYMRLKRKLHGIMVDYINRSAGKQMAYNRTTEHIFWSLVHTLEEQHARIETLEKQISELQSRQASQDK